MKKIVQSLLLSLWAPMTLFGAQNNPLGDIAGDLLGSATKSNSDKQGFFNLNTLQKTATGAGSWVTEQMRMAADLKVNAIIKLVAVGVAALVVLAIIFKLLFCRRKCSGQSHCNGQNCNGQNGCNCKKPS